VYERLRESPFAWPLAWRTLRQETAEILAALDDAVPSGPPEVLDLACGQGTFTVAVGLARPAMKVTGLDISAGQLDRAARRAARAAAANVHFLRGDATRLAFAPASFRAVFSITSLHQIPDHPAVARELGRVSAPGATLFAACLATAGPMSALRSRAQGSLGVHMLRGDEWLRLLDDAGFADARYEQRTLLWGVLTARRR
jgi:ubiquinone/menaquinone biosynthesis C-methylase UbiE